MKTHTVIIWETIPDYISIYIVPDDKISSEQRTLLEATHGNLINTTDWEKNEGLLFIQMALCADTEENRQSNDGELYASNIGLFHPHLRYVGDGKHPRDAMREAIRAEGGVMVSDIICTGFYA